MGFMESRGYPHASATELHRPWDRALDEMLHRTFWHPAITFRYLEAANIPRLGGPRFQSLRARVRTILVKTRNSASVPNFLST